MDDTPVSSSANLLGITTGCLTLLGIALYRAHLPSEMYKHLEGILDETEAIYDIAIEEALLPDAQFQNDMQRRIAVLRAEALAHRRRAYCAPTFVKQYVEFFRGLSFAISRTSHETRCIRGLLIEAIERHRILHMTTTRNGGISDYPTDAQDSLSVHTSASTMATESVKSETISTQLTSPAEFNDALWRHMSVQGSPQPVPATIGPRGRPPSPQSASPPPPYDGRNQYWAVSDQLTTSRSELFDWSL
ncbi:hypothetical protein PLICRDRAFT_453976 [Plicaturopsis crispa FD-325 SS-3]|uniref:Uncharacterized protein n=1 Tax=Plicaturopsis crispa FD-325 SS-3 TaxID=944288 RepID=A0A0C9SQ38_PLICR|nr:hypothetical protein PLICRDRAFT_453976 [Plicaturopsis crispa FD-325 SS-3]